MDSTRVSVSERLLAVADGPPQRRLRNVDHERRGGAVMINCTRDTLAENLSGEGERCFRIKAFQFDPQLHPTVATVIDAHERHYLSYPRKAPAL